MRTPHRILVALIVVASLAVGCGKRDPVPNERIDGITRVFMHSQDDWSMMVRGADGTDTLRTVSVFWGNKRPLVVFAHDVPAGNPMWAVLSYGYPNLGERAQVMHIVFHLHSPDDVNGAGWNRGKFGSGTTTVIE